MKKGFFSFLLFWNIQGNFILFTTLYNETNKIRLSEYMACLRKNLHHPLIEKIIVFYDTLKDNHDTSFLDQLNRLPITIIKKEGRVSFGDIFNEAAFLQNGSKVIIANADIYFNETLVLLTEYDLTNTFLAMTRWNDDGRGNLEIYRYVDKHGKKRESIASQDVWIFKTPLVRFKRDDIFLGIPACDRYIAYEALSAGLKVRNPCLSIQCCHLHNSNIRNYERQKCEVSRAVKGVLWETL